MAPASEQLLIKRIKSGDQTAFEQVYFQYFPVLSRSAFKRLAHEPLVEEIVQDVFVNLWNKRDGLDEYGNLAAYLHATLRNKVLHEMRTLLNKSKYLAPMRDGIDSAVPQDMDEKLMAAEMAQKINTVIDGLPDQCREAFVLSRFQELSYKDIAAQMGISVNTVEKHIGKALKILRSRLEKDLPTLALLGILQDFIQ